MKKILFSCLLIMFFSISSFAQNDPMYDTNKPVNYIPNDIPMEDIQLAGMYMEKAGNRYTTSRILYISGALVPLTLALNPIGSSGRAGVIIGSSLGLVGLGFSFSGDSNLKKGGGILRRIKIQ